MRMEIEFYAKETILQDILSFYKPIGKTLSERVLTFSMIRIYTRFTHKKLDTFFFEIVIVLRSAK